VGEEEGAGGLQSPMSMHSRAATKTAAVIQLAQQVFMRLTAHAPVLQCTRTQGGYISWEPGLTAARASRTSATSASTAKDSCTCQHGTPQVVGKTNRSVTQKLKRTELRMQSAQMKAREGRNALNAAPGNRQGTNVGTVAWPQVHGHKLD